MEKLNEIFTQMNPEEEYISLDQAWTEPLQNVEREGLLLQATITDLQSFFNINDIVIFSPAMAEEAAEDHACGGDLGGAKSAVGRKRRTIVPEFTL